MIATQPIDVKLRQKSLTEDIRRVLFHAQITQFMIRVMKDNILVRKHPEYRHLESIFQKLMFRLQYTIRLMKEESPELKSFVEHDLDVTTEKLNNIAELTDHLGKSNKDLTDQVTLLVNSSWHKELFHRCWKAARDDKESFSEWYARTYP